MRIRDKEFFRLFLVVYTLIFIIIFQCFDIINKMQAELKGRLYNGNYSNLAGIETKCDVCMNHLKAEYNQAGELEAMSIDVPDRHRQKEHLETAKMIIKAMYGRKFTVYSYANVRVSGMLQERSELAVFSLKDELPFNITKGRSICSDDLEKIARVAIVSEDMINTMVKKEEYYYIKINNEEYQVVGIYEPVADKADVCFAYFPQTEYQFEEFCRNFIDNIFSISNMKWGIFGVYIGSENSFDINEIDEFISELEKISDTTFDIKVIDRSIASPNEKIKALIIIYVLLLFFCIVVYIQVIDMFTKKRYKDYVIYRACGCNCNMIARRLFMEMLPMFICSFIAVFIANSVYNVWLTDSVWYSISYEGVAFMAGTSVVLVYMSIFIIIMKLRRINLAEGIMDL